jgi:hypothetical protein
LFGEDIWAGNIPLKLEFPSLFFICHSKCLVAYCCAAGMDGMWDLQDLWGQGESISKYLAKSFSKAKYGYCQAKHVSNRLSKCISRFSGSPTRKIRSPEMEWQTRSPSGLPACSVAPPRAAYPRTPRRTWRWACRTERSGKELPGRPTLGRASGAVAPGADSKGPHPKCVRYRYIIYVYGCQLSRLIGPAAKSSWSAKGQGLKQFCIWRPREAIPNRQVRGHTRTLDASTRFLISSTSSPRAAGRRRRARRKSGITKGRRRKTRSPEMRDASAPIRMSVIQ